MKYHHLMILCKNVCNFILFFFSEDIIDYMLSYQWILDFGILREHIKISICSFHQFLYFLCSFCYFVTKKYYCIWILWKNLTLSYIALNLQWKHYSRILYILLGSPINALSNKHKFWIIIEIFSEWLRVSSPSLSDKIEKKISGIQFFFIVEFFTNSFLIRVSLVLQWENMNIEAKSFYLLIYRTTIFRNMAGVHP